MMGFKSKIKWISLLVLLLSVGSLVVHLSMTKFSSTDLVYYRAMPLPNFDFSSSLGKQRIRYVRNKNLWGEVKSLESLRPYANPRSSHMVPSEKNNGYIYAKIFGGFDMIRSSICDLVAISRLLNATLVIPEIQESLRSKGVSHKFKSFSYLYDEEEFITSLRNDVLVVKNLPGKLKEARRKKQFPRYKPKSSSSPDYYVKEILPNLKRVRVIGLILTGGGCLMSILPHGMSELQRLRCRVAFHALQFRSEIQVLGHQIVQRLQAWGQPFIAIHPGLVRDSLAFHGCAELFQDIHTELIQYRRIHMIKQGILSEEAKVDSYLRQENGSCPLMPEEIGIVLRAFGFPPKTIVYIAGSETFGGQRVLIPLRAMFANSVDRTYMCSKQELSNLVGPEAHLPAPSFQQPPARTGQQLRDEWKAAGPRPRPLPPPPDRPVYQHEKEGWYGWITETDTEPGPSPVDLRNRAHRLLWDAIDYVVSVEADAFFPGFHGPWNGLPDFSSLVMGHRLYQMASSRTFRPDRKVLAGLFRDANENVQNLPKHNWTLLVREHLNRSLGEDGLAQLSLASKPTSFLSHPLPECSCRISRPTAEPGPPVRVTGPDGRILVGGEDECPKWMQPHPKPILVATQLAEPDGPEEVLDSDLQDGQAEQQDSDSDAAADSKASFSFPFDQDNEWDPND